MCRQEDLEPGAYRANRVSEIPQIVVALTFDVHSVSEGERLRRALARSARRVAGESKLRESSYTSNTLAGASEDIDE